MLWQYYFYFSLRDILVFFIFYYCPLLPTLSKKAILPSSGFPGVGKPGPGNIANLGIISNGSGSWIVTSPSWIGVIWPPYHNLTTHKQHISAFNWWLNEALCFSYCIILKLDLESTESSFKSWNDILSHKLFYMPHGFPFFRPPVTSRRLTECRLLIIKQKRRGKRVVSDSLTVQSPVLRKTFNSLMEFTVRERPTK